MSTKTIKWFLRAMVYTKWRLTERYTKETQQRYQEHFDRWIWRQLQFLVIDFVYVDWPPLIMTAADTLATEMWFKLLSRTNRTWQITAVGQDRLTIDEHGVLSRIFIDHVTRGSIPADLLHRVRDNRQRKEKNVKNENSPNSLVCKCTRTSGYYKHTALHGNNTTAATYPKSTRIFPDQIVPNFGKLPNVKCIVHWYGYKASDNTENLLRISQHNLSRDIGALQATNLTSSVLYSHPAPGATELSCGRETTQ